MRRRVNIVVAGLLLLAASRASAQQAAAQQPGWKLQGDVDLMAGQYFFNSSAGSLNGYANADLQLLRSLSSEAGFYLSAKSTYSGFKQVDELAGAELRVRNPNAKSSCGCGVSFSV